MPTKIQLTTFAAAAVLAFAANAQPASASTRFPRAETVSVRVSLADLDLSRGTGMALAHKRIRQAAVFVCGSEPAFAGLREHRIYRNCRRTAVDDAVADLNTQIAALRDSETAPRATALAANR